MTDIPIIVGVLGMVSKVSEGELKQVENRRKNWDHSNYSIAKIGQYTHKSSADLRRLQSLSLQLKPTN